MAKKKKQNEVILHPDTASLMQESFIKELNDNPEFSLDVDPIGKYKMSDEQKKFIMYYTQFKSVGTAAELAGITMDEARPMFVEYSTQCEIRRINRALYQRQFATKLISIDALGGYLSSLLTDENVPIADRLKTADKLRVVDMILRLNEIKSSMNDPKQVLESDLSVQIKNLSITTINQLLTQNNNMKTKNEAISKIDDGSLTIEEKAFLQSLPLPELLKVIDDINKGGSNDAQ